MQFSVIFGTSPGDAGPPRNLKKMTARNHHKNLSNIDHSGRFGGFGEQNDQNDFDHLAPQSLKTSHNDQYLIGFCDGSERAISLDFGGVGPAPPFIIVYSPS